MTRLTKNMVKWLAALMLVVTAGYSQEKSPTPRRSVAFTFDDLPSTNGVPADVIKKLIAGLSRHDIPAIGFVNESKVYTEGTADEEKISLLRTWLDANLDLGNHSFSHVSIDEVPLSDYKADVLKGEKITRALLEKRGKRLSYFRHPQLRTGPTPMAKEHLDNFLAANRYTIAPVTIDNNDYIFANIYERARINSDTVIMSFVTKEYLSYMTEVVKHFEALSKKFLGYELKQILLLHANSLNADHLEELVELFLDRGYQFISIDEALTDPAYRLEDAPSKKGLSWLHRWMLAKNLPLEYEPPVQDSIIQLANSYAR